MRTPSEITVKGLWWMHLLPKTDTDQKFYENFKNTSTQMWAFSKNRWAHTDE